MKLFVLLIAGCFYAGSLPAQEASTDSLELARQREELKQALLISDEKLEQRQQQWLEAQKKKTKYDTIGLGQYRYEMALLKQARKEQEIAFIKQHPDYMASLDALKDAVGALPDDILIYDALFNALGNNVQQSKEGAALRKQIDRFMAVRIGVEAPLFTAPDTLGNPVKLADYRGKYILLDFWASWCFPCRDENPFVVKAWQQYKDRNFDVLSVSLDQPGKRESWLKAIHDDKLPWQHVSDLKYWDNEVARLYAVRSIPQNFLIDPQGKIIAANLRGDQLLQKLEQLLK